MLVDVKIPGVGESIQEATLAEWLKKDGDPVKQDEPLFVIETDKVTLEVVAEASGVLHIKAKEGETVLIGAVVATIDTQGEVSEQKTPKPDETPPEDASEAPAPTPKPAPEPEPQKESTPPLSPAVRNLLAEHALDARQIKPTGPKGRITKADVLAFLETSNPPEPEKETPPDTPKDTCDTEEEKTTRKPMTRIRRRIAERLVQAKQNTAMLTTFNEIDMARVMALRDQYKAEFLEKHGVSLGFMSFFIKACVSALKSFPELNAFIEDEDIVYHHYVHMGVAIGSGRGLVVPVIRHAENRSFAELEQGIVQFVDKIKENRLAVADLEGGTFTVSNGGVYGSLLSTPILNLPQSGILGLHKIEKRPVVIDDDIVIRPMMYVALSYDHRVVDGREAVSFLKSVKSHIENPEQLMLEI